MGLFLLILFKLDTGKISKSSPGDFEVSILGMGEWLSIENTALISDRPVNDGLISLVFGPLELNPSLSISPTTDGDNSKLKGDVSTGFFSVRERVIIIIFHLNFHIEVENVKLT